MEFEYAKLSDKPKKEEIKSEINRLGVIVRDNLSEEQSIKLVINSIYGGIGNPFSEGFNLNVAEAITLQGQDLIKYAESIVNKYFMQHWHKDTRLHELLGVTEVKPITSPVSVYIDTDSCYITFNRVLRSCLGYDGDAIEFVVMIFEYRLGAYLDKCFAMYAEKRNVKNEQDFELETVSYSGLWLAKKKYILDVGYKLTKVEKSSDGSYKYTGIRKDSLNSLTYKGVEIIQSSTPLFARTRLKELVNYLLTKNKRLDLRELTAKLKKMKDEFKLENPENISKSVRVNEYSKYIINDSTGIEFNGSTVPQIRGAALHNYTINQKMDYKQTYELIRNGDKIKYFFTKPKTREGFDDAFAFLPGNYPYQFAPEMDYDTQFEKVILDPLNRLIVAMGFQNIRPNLVVSTKLF